MKTWQRVVLITLVVAAPAFVLAPRIWPPHPHSAAPAGPQLLLFMLLAALEALTLGLGVAFVWYGLPRVRRVTDPSRAATWLSFVATAWLLISWWPHDNMHKHNGMELGGLLVIDYVFHGSMMLAGLVLAHNLVRSLQPVQAAGRAAQRDRAVQ